jgi:hypothetical protein
MNRRISPGERHLCPDCQSEETRGQDKFGFPMPCARCVVERVVKAFDADLEEQGIIAGERAGMEWSRQPA